MTPTRFVHESQHDPVIFQKRINGSIVHAEREGEVLIGIEHAVAQTEAGPLYSAVLVLREG